MPRKDAKNEPRELRTLSDIVDDIAYRKRRAGQARFGRASAVTESPKEVYSRACEVIARTFEADGFRYSRSGPQITRKAGDFKFEVSFFSSRNNVAGEYVALNICATVFSPRLKRWRVSNRSIRGEDDAVAGGQIGNLAKTPAWLEWNLADPNARESQIHSAVGTVRALALPYFDEFVTPSKIAAELRHRDFPGMDLMAMFDFAACFSSLSTARDVAARFLASRPELIERYLERMHHLQKHGLPDGVPSGWVDQLAALSVRFELGDLNSAHR